MNDDIFESVSQGSSGKETAENRRIHEIADELRRRCKLYETQLRNSQGNVSYWIHKESHFHLLSEVFHENVHRGTVPMCIEKVIPLQAEP